LQTSSTVAGLRLVALGYRASRAHYSGTAIKTDAPLPVIEDVISGG